MPDIDQQVISIDKRLTEVAGEVRHNETLLLRAEQIIVDLAEVSAATKARADVQAERMIRILEELDRTQKNIHELRTENLKADKDVIEALQLSEKAQAIKFSKFDERIKRLEKWQWIMIGGGFVIMFLYKFIDLAAVIPAG
tara:strand:- start:2794 stop:3216 length:423 start_codon:yes stop_codon:yes gene_type:complete